MLKLLGAVGVTGLAGCGGDDGEDTPTETDTGGNGNGNGNGDMTDTETDTGSNGNGNGNGDMTDTETDPTGTPTSTPAEPLDPPADLLSLSQNPVSTSSGETVTLEGAVQNAYLFDVHDISVTLSGPEGWSIAEPERTFERLDVGASESVSWEVSVPEDAIGTTELTATTTYASASDEAEVSFPIEIIVIEPADISEPDAYYSLDTDTPVDDSSNGHDGTIQGDVTTGVTGQSGSAYEFDAADGDHVSTSEYYPVTGSDARTTSAWVNIPSSIPSEFGPYARVVAWGGGGVGRRWDLSARDDNITGDGVVTPALEVNGASLIGSTQINDGTWHHIAITFPLSGSTVTDAQLYVDGSPESIATTNNGSRTIDTSTSQSVVIGGNGGSNELEGAVDEVRIYDEELTADQINQLYNDEQ
jgi:hypothetical protein